MNFLENLGAHVIDYRALYFALSILAFMGYLVFLMYSHVLVSSSQFECTATDAVGIHARCTQFTMKRVYSDFGHKNEINQ